MSTRLVQSDEEIRLLSFVIASFVIASPFIFLRRFPPLVGSTALLSAFLPIGA
jgi:hypothetical protein